MKVERTGGSKAPSSTSRSKRKDDVPEGAFARQLEAAMGSQAPAGAGPVSMVDALLAVQEVSDATDGRSKGRKRAEMMLEGLDELRHGLLMGTIPAPKIKALAELCRSERAKVEDPHLKEVLDEVELRAAVELAKLEQAHNDAQTA